MSSKKKASATLKAVPKSTAPLEIFYRIVEQKLKPGDTFKGYQVEAVSIQDGKIAGRELIGKPNLFEYAATSMSDLCDPRNT